MCDLWRIRNSIKHCKTNKILRIWSFVIFIYHEFCYWTLFAQIVFNKSSSLISRILALLWYKILEVDTTKYCIKRSINVIKFHSSMILSTISNHITTFRRLLSNGSLYFSTVYHTRTNRPDEGIYQCVATSDEIGTLISRTATLKVAGKHPNFFI